MWHDSANKGEKATEKERRQKGKANEFEAMTLATNWLLRMLWLCWQYLQESWIRKRVDGTEVFESATKNLWMQKYPATCGRGLS